MNVESIVKRIGEACERHGHPADVRIVFSALSGDAALVQALQGVSNTHQNRGWSLLHDLIAEHYVRAGKAMRPVYRYDVDDDLFLKDTPRLCLGLHATCSPAMAMFLRKGCALQVVSDYPQAVRKVAMQSGIQTGHIALISRDQKCLLRVKQRLAENAVVHSTIDFRQRNPGPFNRLSDGMLKMALKLQPATFFGLCHAESDGAITYVARRLDLSQDLEVVKAEVLAMIARVNPHARFEYDKFDYEEQARRVKALMSS